MSRPSNRRLLALGVLLGAAAVAGALAVATRERNAPVARESPGYAPAPTSFLGARPAARSTRHSFLPPADAPPEAWKGTIERFRAEKDVVRLQALIVAAPGRTPRERALLLADATVALGSLGKAARRSFDDFLFRSPDPEIDRLDGLEPHDRGRKGGRDFDASFKRAVDAAYETALDHFNANQGPLNPPAPK